MKHTNSGRSLVRVLGRSLAGAFVVVVMTASAAVALPPGLYDGPPPGLTGTGDDYSCGTVYGGNGRMGIVDGVLYQAVHVEGTWEFTPTDGEAIGGDFTKDYGKGPTGDTITCTRSDSGSDEEGSWSETVTVTAVKVPGR